MKLTCSQAALNSNLQCVSRAVAARPTHPVLANVLLTADEGTDKVSLTGFDLSLGIQTTFAASVERSGAITLPSRLLVDIVSRLSADSPLALQSPSAPDPDSSSDGDDQGASLSFQLTARTGAYTVRGMPAEDFPELPMAQSPVAIPLSTQSLRDGLARTLFAASSDEAKQILTGVHLSVSPSKLEFAATDGHRLAVLAQPNDNSSVQDEGFQVTIPARSLRELEQLLASRSDESNTIDLYHDQGQVVFLRTDQVVTSRTLDGAYPKYNQLIPETFTRSFSVDRVLMITALERVAVLADQQNSVVKFSVDVPERQLRICAEVQDVGRGDESVPLADGEGDSVEVAFNVRYLLDGLKALPTAQVKFRMNNPVNPVVLQPHDGEVAFTYLVMPVQIRN